MSLVWQLQLIYGSYLEARVFGMIRLKRQVHYCMLPISPKAIFVQTYVDLCYQGAIRPFLPRCVVHSASSQRGLYCLPRHTCEHARRVACYKLAGYPMGPGSNTAIPNQLLPAVAMQLSGKWGLKKIRCSKIFIRSSEEPRSFKILLGWVFFCGGCYWPDIHSFREFWIHVTNLMHFEWEVTECTAPNLILFFGATSNTVFYFCKNEETVMFLMHISGYIEALLNLLKKTVSMTLSFASGPASPLQQPKSV